MPVEIVPYGGPELAVGPFAFAVRAQRHPGGSAGLRCGDRFAYVTDTVADPETAAFARGVGLLFHEVWSTDEEAARDGTARLGHSAVGEVADLARAAGVAALAPVHHHPRRSARELGALVAALAARAGLPVVLPREGRLLALPA
jgi:ribonuclease BN (tRNA processing enzyme)